MHIEKVAMLFYPSVPKPFAFHFPAPVLESAISCPHPPSLDDHRDLCPCRAPSPEKHRSSREGASWAAATDLLDVVDLLGTVRRQDERRVLCYHDVILNAHTNATKSLRGTHIILRDINAWKKEGNWNTQHSPEKHRFLTAQPWEHSWIFSNITSLILKNVNKESCSLSPYSGQLVG